jgi:hypothetical protein
MSYLLDTDVFIRAKNLHYGLDFCPAFWDWLVHKANAGLVFSIDKVADEIKAGQDELTEWANTHGKGLFKRTPPRLAPQFTYTGSDYLDTGLQLRPPFAWHKAAGLRGVT